MGPEFLFMIPLHRVESHINHARKLNLVKRAVEAAEAEDMLNDDDTDKLVGLR
jgi:hypothetical protein